MDNHSRPFLESGRHQVVWKNTGVDPTLMHFVGQTEGSVPMATPAAEVICFATILLIHKRRERLYFVIRLTQLIKKAMDIATGTRGLRGERGCLDSDNHAMQSLSPE